MPSLTADEIKRHPEYGTVVWDLEAAKKGTVSVAKGRGGPFDIAYEVHGTGPLKLVDEWHVKPQTNIPDNAISAQWIMGLGAFMSAWQRQVKDFGHSQNTNRSQSPKYSCLVLDNRGMGLSDKPLIRYSTSEMGKDVVELIDEVGWRAERQLHLIGASLGGMIAQEIALMIPERIASISFICTGPRLINTTGWLQNLRQRVNLFIPRSIDVQLAGTKARLFSEEWLAEPDAEGHFPSNGDRFGAQEVFKRSLANQWTTRGFILQAIAAGWHYKSPKQIEELGDKVGRERIQVIHGSVDQMITTYHGELLTQELGGEEMGVTKIIVPGRGHGLPMEWRKGLTKAIASHIEKTSRR